MQQKVSTRRPTDETDDDLMRTHTLAEIRAADLASLFDLGRNHHKHLIELLN
jgi:hypothetical protein